MIEQEPGTTGDAASAELVPALSSTSLSHKVVRNSLANALRTALSLPVVILLTPFIISKIGTTGFGIWALVAALVSYAGLMDLGIALALVKLVAEYEARGDRSAINTLVNTAFITYAALGMVILAGFWPIQEWIITGLFRIGPEWAHEARFTLIGMLLVLIVNLSFSVFTSVLNGLQRMDLTNLLLMLNTLSSAIATVLVLERGYGLRGMVVANALASVTTIGLGWATAQRQLPSLRLAPWLFRRQAVRNLLGFSLQLQVVGLATLIHTQLDKLILGFFLGANYVAYYEVAARVINQLRTIPVMILFPILPAASEIQVTQQHRILEELYFRAFKYMSLVSLPVFAFMSIFAEPVMRLWLGPGYELAAIALQALAVANFINMLTGPGFLISSGIGRPRYAVYSSLLGIVLNLLLSIGLARLFGFVGALVGTASSLILASGFFVATFHRSEAVSFRSTFSRALGVPLLACLIPGIVLAMLYSRTKGDLQTFILAAAVYAAMYFLIVFRSSHLDRFDRERFKSFALHYGARWLSHFQDA